MSCLFLSKVSLLVVLVGSLTLPAQAQEYRVDLPIIEAPGFTPVVKVLLKSTKARLSIPSTLPKGFDDGQDVFCTITTLKKLEYEIVVGFGVGCSGGNACRIGSAYGRWTGRKVVMGTPNYQFERRKAKPVRLVKGLIGFFVNATCGANCSDSKIFWTDNGWEYMVGLKVGRLAEVRQFANSAILNVQNAR